MVPPHALMHIPEPARYYDRLVHFCVGRLLAYPTREVFLRVAKTRGRSSMGMRPWVKRRCGKC
jgi:hypothetical protein